jgi:hypothetical protein
MNTAHTVTQPHFSTTWSSLNNDTLERQYKRNFSRVLLSGNGAMSIAMIGIIICIVIGYTHDEYFSLWTQVASHVALILFATAVKIGYVMRCIGLHGLGNIQL